MALGLHWHGTPCLWCVWHVSPRSCAQKASWIFPSIPAWPSWQSAQFSLWSFQYRYVSFRACLRLSSLDFHGLKMKNNLCVYVALATLDGLYPSMVFTSMQVSVACALCVIPHSLCLNVCAKVIATLSRTPKKKRACMNRGITSPSAEAGSFFCLRRCNTRTYLRKWSGTHAHGRARTQANASTLFLSFF